MEGGAAEGRCTGRNKPVGSVPFDAAENTRPRGTDTCLVPALLRGRVWDLPVGLEDLDATVISAIKSSRRRKISKKKHGDLCSPARCRLDWVNRYTEAGHGTELHSTACRKRNGNSTQLLADTHAC